MAQIHVRSLDREGEAREFKAHGRALVGNAGGAAFMKATFEPGWRWSTDIGPAVGASSCQVRHLGYVISGAMHVTTDDGTEADLAPGDMFDLPAGHDAYVVGDEPCVLIDIAAEATAYATGAAGAAGTAEDRNIALVRRGYAAFNSGDIETLVSLFSHDVVQHVPGNGELAGAHKGIDGVLQYYGELSRRTDGTFRAHLVEAHGDGGSHVVAIHQMTATRAGTTRVSRGSILFTLLDGKVTDMLELRADLAGDDAFLG